MQNYETMVIVRSAVSEEETNTILGKFKEIIEKAGGTVIQAESWGKRRLAYEIQGEKKGAYLLLRFRADGKLIAQLEHQYRLDEAILKFLTVRLEGPLSPVSTSGLAGDKKTVHERMPVEEASSPLSEKESSR